MSDLPYDRRSHFWLLNNESGDVYPLGPMYGTDARYAVEKLRREDLTYEWTLLEPVVLADLAIIEGRR